MRCVCVVVLGREGLTVELHEPQLQGKGVGGARLG